MQYAHVHHNMKATLILNVLKVCNFFGECVIIINSIASLKFTCVQMHYVSNNEMFFWRHAMNMSIAVEMYKNRKSTCLKGNDCNKIYWWLWSSSFFSLLPSSSSSM